MEQRLDRLAQRVADTGLAAIQFVAFVGHAVRLILQSFHLLVRGPSIGQPVRLRHVVEEIITGGIQSLPVVILTVALIDATRVFRLSRALALDASVMDYVVVARARGEGVNWIMLHEILPNTITPLAAEFGVRYTFAILFISSLSFLGLGVQPPGADWGVMVKENLQGLLYGAPAALIPAACIGTISVAINLLVDWFLHRSSVMIPEELTG